MPPAFPSGFGLWHSPGARRGALAEIGRVLCTLFVPSRRLKASFQRRSGTKKPDDLHHPAYFFGERGILTYISHYFMMLFKQSKYQLFT
jgi:hypothetical protein